MKTELEEISSIRKRLKIEVPADAVNAARRLAVQQLQKEAKIEGFRTGKVPADIIEKRFPNEIQKQTIENVVDQTLIEALEQSSVRPISRPEVVPGIFGPGGNFNYTATFEILPVIMLKEKDYRGLKLERTETKVEKAEVEEEIRRLQAALTQLEPTAAETALDEGHVATIDFTGTLDGLSFEGGTSKDYPVELGTGAVLADFEKVLKGAKAGEMRNVHFTYPKDYFNKELAGKKAEFKVTVKTIRKKNVPTLDDDFAKDLGEFQTLKEVTNDLEKRIGAAKESRQKSHLYNQILKELVGKVKFEIPESLVHSELSGMLKQFAHELKQRGQKVEDVNVEETVKEFKPEAEFRVRSFLILHQIAESLKLSATDQEVEERLQTIAKGLNRPAAEVREHYEKQKLMGSLQTRILHEKALEFVLNEAKIRVSKGKIKGE